METWKPWNPRPLDAGIREHSPASSPWTSWEYKGDPALPSYTLIQLIYSLRALPVDLSSPAVRVLAWLMLHSDLEGTDEQAIYFGVGLLWLALRRNPPPPHGDLVGLSEWIVRRESELAKKLQEVSKDRWLLGCLGNYPPPSPWESLGSELRSLDLSSHQRQLEEWVKLIGNELVGDSSVLKAPAIERF